MKMLLIRNVSKDLNWVIKLGAKIVNFMNTRDKTIVIRGAFKIQTRFIETFFRILVDLATNTWLIPQIPT